MNTVVLIKPTIDQSGVDLLKKSCNIVMAPDGNEDTLIQVINESNAIAILPRSERITANIMDHCPTLKIVSVPGVGLDNVDIPAANRNGIMVMNVPDGNYTTVAEHTILFILACAQNLIRTDRNVRAGNWGYRDTNLPCDIAGKTLFIAGFGRIGRQVAKYAQVFGMNIIAYDEYVSEKQMSALHVTKVTLDEGLRRCDFLTIHVPLTEETRNMFTHEQFEKMKSSAYVCNLGRGPVLDEKALYSAIKVGKLAGAALDVYSPEPPSPNNPLFQLDNIIFTPHSGGDTKESRKRLACKAALAIIDSLNGNPPIDNWANRPAQE